MRTSGAESGLVPAERIPAGTRNFGELALSLICVKRSCATSSASSMSPSSTPTWNISSQGTVGIVEESRGRRLTATSKQIRRDAQLSESRAGRVEVRLAASQRNLQVPRDQRIKVVGLQLDMLSA